MRTKLLVPTVFIITAILLSACSASVSLGQTQPKTISVTGNAQVILAPDIAYVSIGVHSEAQTAEEAVASNNTQTQAVIDAIKAQGVDPKDIQTTNFSVYQQQKTNPTTGESLGTVFMVDNTVYVTIRDLTKIGSILDASISAGANNIYGITFDVQNKEAAMATGRDQAMTDAQTQAEQLAKAAGVTLGDVQNISYYSSSSAPIYYDNKVAPAGVGGGGSVPISTGQLTLTVSVSVSYGIK
jgi:uncharacterized protein